MNSSDILKRLTEAGRLDRFYIDGQWTLPSGQGRAPVTDPSTERVVAEIAMGDSQDVAQAVGAARRAFADWSALEPQARCALLDRLHGLSVDLVRATHRPRTTDAAGAVDDGGEQLLGRVHEVLR